MTFFEKKLFVILNDSEGSTIRHASSPCKSANRSFTIVQDDKPFKGHSSFRVYINLITTTGGLNNKNSIFAADTNLLIS